MVPEEESQAEDIDDTPIAEDDEVVFMDATMSSTAVSPEPIPIPAPIRASVRRQQAVKGHGTEVHPYELDFTPAAHGFHALPARAHSE